MLQNRSNIPWWSEIDFEFLRKNVSILVQGLAECAANNENVGRMTRTLVKALKQALATDFAAEANVRHALNK